MSLEKQGRINTINLSELYVPLLDQRAGNRDVTGKGSGTNQPLELATTADFPYDDPWSSLMRKVVGQLYTQGGFYGDYFEAGIGDARNLFAAGIHHGQEFFGIQQVKGVEFEKWRLNLAKQNLQKTDIEQGRIDLYEGDVVKHLQELPEGERLTGWGVACLPQAPTGETINTADGEGELPSFQSTKNMQLKGRGVGAYGLTLNTAFLTALRDKVDTSDFNLLIMLSGRAPQNIREQLLERTGWSIVEEFRTEQPIQQDPDTGVAYVEPYDTGELFYEHADPSQEFRPITAREAEARRKVSNQSRKSLNVFHHLSVYHVQPDSKKFFERVVYEK